jgi:hypothetical protein
MTIQHLYEPGFVEELADTVNVPEYDPLTRTGCDDGWFVRRFPEPFGPAYRLHNAVAAEPAVMFVSVAGMLNA